MIQKHSAIGFRIIASLFLAMILAASLLPFSAFADDSIQTQADDQSGTSGSCTWEITNSGVLRIASNTGNIGVGTLGSFGSGSNYAPWTHQNLAGKIRSVVVSSDINAGASLFGMFTNCKNMTMANITQMDTTNTTNMSNLFYGCTELKEAYLAKLNTANVTDMSSMFSGC